MSPTAPSQTLDAAVARIGNAVVAVCGPSGSGKTGVLLALMRDGAVPVAFERVAVTAAGVVRHDGAIRLRAHHLHVLPRQVHLSLASRARLRLGQMAMRLPAVGRRAGRRCFVDVAASAVEQWAQADRIDLVFVLDPTAAGDPPTRPATMFDACEATTLSIGTARRTPASVADTIRVAMGELACSPSR